MTEQFFDDIFEGKLGKEEIKLRLEEIYQRGETVDEIVAAVISMRAHMISIKPKVEEDLLDIVGTGGDGKSTLNISTIAAFVAAGAGCYIAKHCNKGVSSKFGSVDLLEKLGLDVNLSPEKTRELIETIGIGFMYAPLYHPTMKHAAEARKELGHRSIFNLLGPLTNPANAQTRLIGAYSFNTAKRLAHVSRILGIKRVISVYSGEGLDEISADYPTSFFDTTNPESCFLGDRGDIYLPEGYSTHKNKTSLRVESAKQSAEICRKIIYNQDLSKDETMMKKAVILNAGFGIYLNKGLSSPYEGMGQARESIESGAAADKLEQLIKATQ